MLEFGTNNNDMKTVLFGHKHMVGTLTGGCSVDMIQHSIGCERLKQ